MKGSSIMKRVMSYYGKHILSILLLVAILVVQVKFELMLPKYTSDIVNVGIQQGGLKESTPRVIDEKTYGVLLSITKVGYKGKIASSYERWEPKSNSQENKKIRQENENSKMISSKYEDTNYYVLKDKLTKSDYLKLDKYMADSLTKMAIYLSNKDIEAGKKPRMELASDTGLTEQVKKQISVRMVKELYKTYGVNVDKIQKAYMWSTARWMLFIALLGGIASIGVSFISSRVSTKIARNLRRDSYSKVLKFSQYEMNRFSSASLISRCTNDIQQIQQSSVMALRFIFYGPIMAIGAFSSILKLNVSMIWIIVLAILVTLVSIAVVMYIAMPRFKIVQSIVDKLNLVSMEFISGIEVNRVFGTAKYEEERFDKVNTELTGIYLFISRLMSIMQPMLMFVMNGATLLIIWFGAKAIESGNLQVGDMMAFIQYAMQIIMAFLFISMMSIIVPRAMISANRVGEVLDCEILIKDEGRVNKFNKEGSIEFKDVSFRYEGAEEDIISDISFSIPKGNALAIIGSTGSGKSTIVKLIPRFLEATSGNILVDGVDVRNMPLKVLRSKISLVNQKATLFSGTIGSNIGYANPAFDHFAIKQAAEISQSMEFIQSKKDSFDSKVEQAGANLSGGQKQRISIARAIARDPEIIVFDDSFSALDSKTDRMLRRSIKEKLSDKTIIVVAQRINTIMDADEILVIENGKIAGRGRHKDLLRTCEVYYEIAKSQMTEEELNNEISE